MVTATLKDSNVPPATAKVTVRSDMGSLECCFPHIFGFIFLMLAFSAVMRLLALGVA